MHDGPVERVAGEPGADVGQVTGGDRDRVGEPDSMRRHADADQIQTGAPRDLARDQIQ